MVTIKVGEVYEAEKFKHGTTDKGDYEFILVRDEKKKKAVTIWVQNIPCNVVEGGKFRVTRLDEVQYKARKFQEKWLDEVNVKATVEPIVDWQTAQQGFGMMPDDDGGELPF